MLRLHFLLPLMGLLVLSSCEDVVDIDTPTGDRRLIIDALIRIDTSEAITEMRVVVSETNGFFETIPPANLQQITLSNLDNPLPDAVVFIEEEPGTGVYVKSLETALLLEDRWLLQIDFEDEFFLAETTFAPAPVIDQLEQGDGFVFDDAIWLVMPTTVSLRVWRSEDGATWHPRTSSIPPNITWGNYVVHDGLIYAMAGSYAGFRNLVWVSRDGDNYERVSATENEVFRERYLAQAVSHNGRVWLMGGNAS